MSGVSKQIHPNERFNRQRRTPFQTIVHVNVALLLFHEGRLQNLLRSGSGLKQILCDTLLIIGIVYLPEKRASGKR